MERLKSRSLLRQRTPHAATSAVGTHVPFKARLGREKDFYNNLTHFSYYKKHYIFTSIRLVIFENKSKLF